MTTKNNYTYQVAFKELQEIVQKIELGDVDIDKLSEYIKRATSLVKICEAKLTETEEEVQSLLQKLNEKDKEVESDEGDVEDYDSIDEDTSDLIEEEKDVEHTKDIENDKTQEEE